MTWDPVLLQEIQHKILNAHRILLTSHIRPDGDAIGSLLGLGLALQAAGKDIQMVLEDPPPPEFKTLPGCEQINRHPAGNFDFTCVVDCSDLVRTGKVLKDYAIPDLNIDHHITNLNFARVNLVDSKAVATAEILAEFIKKISLPITKSVATALLTGIITDTLGFRTSNMTPKALRLTADLMEMDVDLPGLYRQTLLTRSFEATRYWSCGLAQLERNERMVWATLTLADRKRSNYPGKDDADLINILSAIEDAQVAIIFVEQSPQRVKVSWRAQAGIDISNIAVRFGGGGHPAAAGADIPGSLDKVRSAVLEVTHAFLEEVTLLDKGENNS